MSPGTHSIGAMLREWRNARRLSQLDLALEAGISARHLSFVETGKSQPSRNMIALLASVLEMPLRDRNALLTAAGYAAQYSETTLATPEMAPVRKAVETILAHHDPFPALATNRHWDLMLANPSLARIFRHFIDRPSRHTNILLQTFDPEEFRPSIVNWREMAEDLILRLHNQVAAAPSDRKSAQLLEQVLSFPDIPDDWRRRRPGAVTAPLLTCVFRRNGLEMSFFSTFTTFGTPWDVTLDELRIECMFPADEKTADLCRGLR